MKHKSDNYWQLVKPREQKPATKLVELGTIAEHHQTEIAHAMLLAIIVAKYDGSAYGWK